MQNSAALSCVGFGCFVTSTFVASYAIALVIGGLAFVLLALFAALGHQLT
jgi:hypothetical protein